MTTWCCSEDQSSDSASSSVHRAGGRRPCPARSLARISDVAEEAEHGSPRSSTAARSSRPRPRGAGPDLAGAHPAPARSRVRQPAPASAGGGPAPRRRPRRELLGRQAEPRPVTTASGPAARLAEPNASSRLQSVVCGHASWPRGAHTHGRRARSSRRRRGCRSRCPHRACGRSSTTSRWAARRRANVVRQTWTGRRTPQRPPRARPRAAVLGRRPRATWTSSCRNTCSRARTSPTTVGFTMKR